MHRWQATSRLGQGLRIVAVLSVFGLAELVAGLITGVAALVAVGSGAAVGGLVICVLAVVFRRRDPGPGEGKP